MDEVLARSKDFDYLVTTFDPLFNDLVAAIEVVKKFIIDNNLIVYGGTAIDYALRLHGDKIYPDDMLKVPDLDVYSPNNTEHAYQLANILYRMGYKNARAINALHIETMRVDLGDNHFIADITYRPPGIFKQLPYLNYNGMRIIHPLFQRIDLHSSLSFPYDNPPREVIFDRWGKDIKRFNALDKYYPPIPLDGSTAEPLPLRPRRCSSKWRRYVLCGFAAYSLIYTDFARQVEDKRDILPAIFSTDDDGFEFTTLNERFEIVHFRPHVAMKEFFEGTDWVAPVGFDEYEPYINLLPARYESQDITIYSTKNRLVSVNSVEIGGRKFRVVNVQYLLKHFLAMYFVSINSPRVAATYLRCYNSLIKMIQKYEAVLERRSGGESVVESAKRSPLFPSVHTYGAENINLSREVALAKLYSELDGTEPLKIPANYYPERSVGLVYPSFDPGQVEFFKESGAFRRRITAADIE